MTITRHYLPENRFMLTWLRDEMDDAQLQEHIDAINDELEDMSGYRELADCRNVSGLEGMSVGGIVESARLEQAKREWRLAILIPPDDPLRFGLARAFQIFAVQTHEAVEIFTAETEALRWLLEDEAERVDFARFMHEQQRGREATAG